MIKGWLKQILYSVAPHWTARVMAPRSRAQAHAYLALHGYPERNDRLLAHFGNRILEGPFQGLALSPVARAEHLGPYVMGTYESELEPAWRRIFRGKFVQILDVGASFGFYAVGLARQFPAVTVDAFDIDWWARDATTAMAEVNAVKNVQIQGRCDPDWLMAHLNADALILSDCEGYEGELFCSRAIAALSTATMLIEVHDQAVPGVRRRLLDRLSSTHLVQEILSDPTPRPSPREIPCLPEKERPLVTTELREPQSWLACWPRNGTDAGLGGE
jgi:hypothetical protein